MIKKALHILTILAISSTIFSCSEEKAKGPIKLGNEEWAVSRSMNYLGKIVLEKNGFPAEIINEHIESIYGDLNTGKIDLFLDTWVEGHGVYVYELHDVEDLGTVYEGCQLGMAVPSYFEVDSISDLLKDSSSYGNVLYGVNKDAGVMIGAKTAMKQYGLKPQVISMTEDELVNQLQLMIDKNQNFVTAAWKPHWKIHEYGLKFLVDTTHSFIEGDEIRKYARPGFEKSYPEAAKILKKIVFSDDEMSEYLLALKGATEPEDIEARIIDWIENHPEKSKEWLPAE